MPDSLFDLEVRPAAASDADGLLAIWQESAETLAKLDSRFRVAPEGAERWRAAFTAGLTDADRFTLVAVRNQAIIGYLIGVVQPNAPGLLPEKIGVVLELSVDSHGHGGGIGTQLFAALADWFKTQDVTQIEVRVPVRNAIAQAFWRALGATTLYDQLWIKRA